MERSEDAVFRYDETHSLLICISCRYAVNPKTLKEHLRKNHSHLDKPTRRQLEAEWRTVEAHENITAFMESRAGKEDLALIQNVNLNTNGFKCQECDYVSAAISTLEKHLSKSHNIPTKLTGDHLITGVPIQQIFRDAGYTRVVPTSETSGEPRNEAWAQVLNGAMATFRRREAEEQLRHSRIPTETDKTDTTPWLERVGWARHLAGKDSRALVNAARLPGGEEQGLEVAAERTKNLFKRCNENAQDKSGCSRWIRRVIASATDAYTDEPDNFSVTDETLDKYIIEWQHLICYLLRSWPSQEEHGMTLTEDQMRLIHELQSAVDDESTDGKEIEDIILRLSANMLQQVLARGYFASPLMHFLAIKGIDPKNLVLRTPSQYTGILSAFVYLAKLVHLETVVPPERRESEDFVEPLREYHQKFICDSATCVLPEMTSQRRYGMAIGSQQNVKPAVTWSQDMGTIFWKGDKIRLEDIRTMTQKLIEEAEGLMCNKLVSREESYLESRDPIWFKDDLSMTANGHNFVLDEKNNLNDGAERVLRWFEEGNNMKLILKRAGNWDFDARLTNKYAGQVAAFEDLLMFLCHITAGMPARGTEFTSVKIFNTWKSMRGIYIHDEAVMCVTEYHKSQGRTGKPRVIARFPPGRVGRLLIAYISDVLPFLAFLQDASNIPRSGGGPFIWTTRSGPSSTDRLSDIISKQTLKHLKVGLKVSSWRHIAIAIDRDLIQDQNFHSILLDEESPHDAQAAHSGGTARTNYAVRADLLAGLHTSTLRAFRNVSDKWHEMLGVASKMMTSTSALSSPATSPRKDKPLGTLQSGSRMPASSLPSVTHNMPVFQVPIRPTDTLMIPETPPLTGRYSEPSGTSRIEGNRNVVVSDLIWGSPEQSKSIPSKRRRTSGTDMSQKRVGSVRGEGILTRLRSINPALNKFRNKGQEDAICTLEDTKDDLIIVLPTAGGKSMCYISQALLHPGKTTVVVIPYVALMQDTIRGCKSWGVDPLQWKQGETQRSSLVFVAVETAVSPNFQGYLAAMKEENNLSMIVFEEAHTIISEGNFRNKMINLNDVARIAPRKVALTGTLPRNLEKDLRSQFSFQTAVTCRHSTARGNIAYSVVSIAGRNFHNEVLDILKKRIRNLKAGDKMVIYPVTKEECEGIAKDLQCGCYYSQKDNKDKIFEDWRNGIGSPAIVGTGGLGVGIDIPKIKSVYLVGNTFTLTTAVQEWGRAAREENSEGEAVMLIEDQRLGRMKMHVPAESERQAMENFLKTDRCRRLELSRWLDDTDQDATCGDIHGRLCDNCQRSSTQDPFQGERTTSAGVQSGWMSAPVGLDPPRESLLSIWEGLSSQTPIYTSPYAKSVDEDLNVSWESQSGYANQRASGLVATETSRGQEGQRRISGGNGFSEASRSTERYDTSSLATPRLPEVISPQRSGSGSGRQMYRSGHREFLIDLYGDLSEMCPVCWLTVGPESAKHRFRECRNNFLTWRGYMDKRRGLSWSGNCAFKCGAPRFVCEKWQGGGECEFMDITVPLVMAGTTLEPFKGKMGQLTDTINDDRRFLAWLTDIKQGNEPTRLGREPVTNAILCVDMIAREKARHLGML